MSEFSTPKGMRDFSGPLMLLRQKMVQTIEGVYQAWGYQPLWTPAMESVQTLNAKAGANPAAGAEIAGQLFKIQDSALALRFDLTVPLARFAAGTSLPRPYKRYCIAPVWRREEPQKGRLREFLQADADIVGTSSMRAEAELLAMASEALAAVGINEFEIVVNNRKILSGLMGKLKLEDKETAVFRILDKLDKIGPEAVEAELKKAAGAASSKKIMEFLLGGAPKSGRSLSIGATARECSPEGAKELEELFGLLNQYGSYPVRFDPSLVRGLGYYTGPIFEIKAGGGVGSVAGGGRYDNLLSLYGKGDCAVGISLGIERLIALQEAKLAPKSGAGKDAKGGAKMRSSLTNVLLVAIDEDCYPKTLELAAQLRRFGIRAETDLNARNMRKQLDYANASGIPFALVVGKNEISSNQYALKDLQTGEQISGSLEALINKIGAKLR